MFDIFKPYPKLFFSFSEKKDGSMKCFREAEYQKLTRSNFKKRESYLQKFGIAMKDVVIADLAHGNNVAIVDSRPHLGVMGNCDGLITKKENIFLSVTAADCLPIFLFEPREKLIGIIHAGWKSLDKEIVKKTLEKIEKLGGKAGQVLVGIGPAICQKHYEVGTEVAAKFEKYPTALRQSKNSTFLDIKEVARLQFEAMGVLENNIESSLECTLKLSDKYFSARRDKPKEVEAMLAIIGLRNKMI